MSKLVRIVQLILLGCVVASAAPSAQAQQAETLAQKREAGRDAVFRIGYRTDASPFSFVADPDDRNAQPMGFTIDVCQPIADALAREMTVEYVPVTAGSRFEMLETGEIDLLCGATTFTLERQRLYQFSLMTFVTSASFIHRTAAPAKANDGMGLKVGVIANSTSLDALRQLKTDRALAIDIIDFPSHTDGVEALRSGDLDSYFGDSALLGEFVADSDGALGFAEAPIGNEPYALAMRPGDPDLLFFVNSSLVETFRERRKIGLIFEKWFRPLEMGASLRSLYSVMTVPIGAPNRAAD